MRSKKDAYLVFAVLTIAPIVVAIGLTSLAYFALFELKTFVSVVVTEAAVGIILYFLLNRRRDKVEELLNLSDASEKFEHLNIYIVEAIHPAISNAYVENKSTKKVYYAPSFITQTIPSGVIPTVAKLKNDEEFEELIKKKGLTLIDHKPSFYELKKLKKEGNVLH